MIFLISLRTLCIVDEKKVTVEGVYRKRNSGAPGEIIQDEILARKKQKLVESVGTLHTSVTYQENHPDHAVVAVSSNDKNIVYLVTSVAESIEWNNKTKKT